MNPQQMTGLEIMQAFADERHTNPLGGVHGGFAATVLDSVTGCATHTALGAGESYGTIELNVKMSKAIPFNRTLRAEGKVINVSSRLVISEGSIRDEDGTLYAYGTATCMILR